MYVPHDVVIEEIQDRLLAHGISTDFRDGRIAASYAGSIAWIEPDVEGELEREGEPDELALVEGLIGRWNAFVVDYRTIEVADTVVAAICGRWPCVVDNDDGFIGWAMDYLKRRVK
ncbi:hypothetical protein ACH4TV_03700 [Streptomyces sp. NPDC020898]|uniref:hypothetical protein n=1 Tax=Streptomyces sp. NPDC020898 TaxID=3365101 RepID=UPI003788ACF8